ncbi:chemotaxis protein CheA [Paralcaligenes ureilyticus]|uniref:Chemotaxis protein CheA n=1 Tax=Paralcaligenes ureilyticus TaxID=627131 RepID=A0A4R3M6Q7_9BURK|nr:chemotaxis protein CheA [Paralcaligenes ureilyticus]TCT08686.1 CheA signal transduction histidine kinase [Paralcaligenes ureilyticus]
MSDAGVDLSQFFETFFDEADELLVEMERLLLELDIAHPDADQLNGIFRAAHSIKGGAGTFGCFGYLADTTHLLENLLDFLRRGEMPLRKDMIDLFLDAKDVLTDQIAAYRSEQEPDAQAYERIGAQLRELAREQSSAQAAPAPASAPLAASTPGTGAPSPVLPGAPVLQVRIDLRQLGASDADALLAEMAIMGEVLQHELNDKVLRLSLQTTCSADDIEAVCCFIVNPDQIQITQPGVLPKPNEGVDTAAATNNASAGGESGTQAPSPTAASSAAPTPARGADHPGAASSRAGKESGTIRVGVEKVDQIINLVGELVITQAMLVQTASTLDPVLHDRLLNGIEQLERNARALQESVMSIRMMPMDYVFSRFPRLVRESASRLGKQINLQTYGHATELDKSLIERIIDPLTHLVRNSLDHGIETPEKRIAGDKNPEGQITLSAQHSGGQIIIEVSDDGCGLNRERILKKAAQQGIAVSDNASDEEVWQLIFVPGFSTAEQITDISGRGVGMDVVRRNIQGMGGHIQLSSRPNQGTTTRIILPLTLAILDGMSVRVGAETFILPLGHVMESMQPTADQIHNISEDEHVLHVRGEYLPLVALHKVFSVENAQTEISQSIAVVLQADDVRFALLVDHLIGQHQVVVKNLESNYRKIPGVSAATILGDGSVALIVDVFALLRVTRELAAKEIKGIIGERND